MAHILLRCDDPQKFPKIIKWCKEKLGPRGINWQHEPSVVATHYDDSEYIRFWFKDEKAALWFSLTWGEDYTNMYD